METSLHQQLKSLYAGETSNTEVSFKGFRIDAIADDGELIEIQQASLGALRDKTKTLLPARGKHRLRIVKPIIRRKRLITLDQVDGDVIRSRMSPKTCDWLELFKDLVHFANVFPRSRLTLEVVLLDAEEIRIDRVPKRRRGKAYKTLDIRLVEVREVIHLETLPDLMARLPLQDLAAPFDTLQLATALQRPRWLAQKVAYCLRTMGGIERATKCGNSQLYRITGKPAKNRVA